MRLLRLGIVTIAAILVTALLPGNAPAVENPLGPCRLEPGSVHPDARGSGTRAFTLRFNLTEPARVEMGYAIALAAIRIPGALMVPIERHAMAAHGLANTASFAPTAYVGGRSLALNAHPACSVQSYTWSTWLESGEHAVSFAASTERGGEFGLILRGPVENERVETLAAIAVSDTNLPCETRLGAGAVGSGARVLLGCSITLETEQNTAWAIELGSDDDGEHDATLAGPGVHHDFPRHEGGDGFRFGAGVGEAGTWRFDVPLWVTDGSAPVNDPITGRPRQDFGFYGMITEFP